MAGKEPRICAICGEPLPGGAPRVELRIQRAEPNPDDPRRSLHEKRTTLYAAQLCGLCGTDLAADVAETVVAGGGSGGGFDRERYSRALDLVDELHATLAAWGTVSADD